jgi:hypothetical protein
LTRNKHGIDDVTPIRRSMLPPVAFMSQASRRLAVSMTILGVLSRRQRIDPASKIGATSTLDAGGLSQPRKPGAVIRRRCQFAAAKLHGSGCVCARESRVWLRLPSIHAYGAAIDLATKFGDYWLWSKGKDGRIA